MKLGRDSTDVESAAPSNSDSSDAESVAPSNSDSSDAVSATPSNSESVTASSARERHRALSGVALLHAFVFFYILSAKLPYKPTWWWSAALLGLATAHLATAVSAALALRWFGIAARVTAFLSLAALVAATWVLAQSAVFISSLYEGLGQGVAAALAVLWAVIVLFTLPLSCWCLALTAPRHKAARPGATLLAVLLFLCFIFDLASVRAQAASLGTERFAKDDTQLAELAGRLETALLPRPNASHLTLLHQDPVHCAAPPNSEQATLIAVYNTSFSADTSVAHCIQADSATLAIKALEQKLIEDKAIGAVSIDFVVERARVSEGTLLDPFKLRPGLDGACSAKACFAPWQLLTRGYFGQYVPARTLPDIRFGLALRDVIADLGGGKSSPLTRIVTRHFLVQVGEKPTPLYRLRPGAASVDDKSLAAAAANAEAHILNAQRDDGIFRYTLDPGAAALDGKHYNLARQAGTTLALCELGSQATSADSIERALAALLKDKGQAQSRDGKLSFLRRANEKKVRLASNTLPLAAFVSCRERVGAKFDAEIVQFSKFLLAMQRKDGGFFPHFDRKRQRPLPGPEPLFAPGQAILALVRLEQLAQARQLKGLPSLAKLTRATERAMNFVAHEHWAHPLYNFFFLEENWHCIAARAALSSHRNAAYEQFCLDYVRAKSRFILDEKSDVAPEFMGAMGFGNVMAPNNTGTAGLAEALAAAIAVRKARAEAADEEEQALKLTLSYLLRQQWTPLTLFAASSVDINGALSADLGSLITRIDFVQHAWSAFGHGARALGLFASGTSG